MEFVAVFVGEFIIEFIAEVVPEDSAGAEVVVTKLEDMAELFTVFIKAVVAAVFVEVSAVVEGIVEVSAVAEDVTEVAAVAPEVVQSYHCDYYVMWM